MGQAANFKFGLNIQRVHPNKSPLKTVEKSERERIQGLPKFLGYCYFVFFLLFLAFIVFFLPLGEIKMCIISGTGKATNFKYS